MCTLEDGDPNEGPPACANTPEMGQVKSMTSELEETGTRMGEVSRLTVVPALCAAFASAMRFCRSTSCACTLFRLRRVEFTKETYL